MRALFDQDGLALERGGWPSAAPSPESALRNTPSPAADQAAANDPLTQCTLALVTDRAGFDALEEEWNALFARAGRPCNVFQSFNWLWHWANHYLDGRNALSVVIGRRGGRLAMAWPLVATRVAGVRRLSWMGEPVSQYGDALVEPTPDAPDLLRQAWALVRSLDAYLVYLPRTRSDAAIAPLLDAVDAISTGSAQAPYLDLASAGDFATYQQRYPAKTRSSRRRHLRRLNDMGAVSFEQHMGGPAARDLVSQALALKSGWLASRGRLAPALQDPRFTRFFADVALGRTHPTGARISAVRCNGQPVAVEISLACKGHLFGHVIAHDGAFQKQGVGVIVAHYAIRTAHEQGCSIYDLLPPADGYKLDWADAAIAVDDYAVALSRAGEMHARLWLRSARPWLKRLANRMPARLAAVLSAACRRFAELSCSLRARRTAGPGPG
jgi:CelD/BcsL family acetyltransferase involved in cellulose biosynthesis